MAQIPYSGPAIFAVQRDLKGSVKGDKNKNKYVEVDVDIDRFGCLKIMSKSV